MAAHPAATVGRVVVSVVVGTTGGLALLLATFGGFDWVEAVPPTLYGAAHMIGSWLIWPRAADLGLGA